MITESLYEMLLMNQDRYRYRDLLENKIKGEDSTQKSQEKVTRLGDFLSLIILVLNLTSNLTFYSTNWYNVLFYL